MEKMMCINRDTILMELINTIVIEEPTATTNQVGVSMILILIEDCAITF